MNTLLLAALTFWQVYPYGESKILPDEPLPESAAAKETTALTASAAIGEFEAVSFVVKSDADVNAIDFVPEVPGVDVDILVVKCWLRGKNSWTTDRWCGGRGDNLFLTPDMILHDDALIKVDEAKHINYLRVDYATGTKYLDMCRVGRKGFFNTDLHPVHDAPKYVPTFLQKGRNKQFLVRFGVPKTAKGGEIKGKIRVIADKKELAPLTLAIKVRPFALPGPRTHYDSSKVFYGGAMGCPTLEDCVKNGKNLAQAEKKMAAIFKCQVEHNLLFPSGPGEMRVASDDDLCVRGVKMMRNAGMPCTLLMGGAGVDIGWFVNDGQHKTPEQDPMAYTNALKRFASHTIPFLDVCKQTLGHCRIAFGAFDETDTWGNRQSYGFYKMIRERGGLIYASSGVKDDIDFILDIDGDPAGVSWSHAKSWHDSGAIVTDYAATFWGVECPDIWRRTGGLRFWAGDFDGHYDLGFACGKNRWNDNIWRGGEGYRQFGCAYPTIDGCVITMQLEGFREGLDDIRYATLHRLLAEKARDSKDAAIAALGRRELVWMESKNFEFVFDLDAFREEMAQHIEGLIAKVGALPPEPEVAPMTIAPDGVAASLKETDGAKRGAAFAAMDRYDLAIPEYQKALKSEGMDNETRTRLAIATAGLMGETLQRDAAAKLLEDTAARPELTQAQRNRLRMARADALMTDEAFEEIFATDRLDRAEEAVEKALGTAGLDRKTRFNTVQRLVDVCNQSEQYDRAIKVAQAHVKDVGFDERDQGHFEYLIACAYRAKNDLKETIRHARFSLDLGGTANHADGREPLLLLGRTAVEAENWEVALEAWTKVLPMINKQEEAPLYEGAQKQIVECGKKLRTKASKTDVSAEEEAPVLDLDD